MDATSIADLGRSYVLNSNFRFIRFRFTHFDYLGGPPYRAPYATVSVSVCLSHPVRRAGCTAHIWATYMYAKPRRCIVFWLNLSHACMHQLHAKDSQTLVGQKSADNG